MMADRLAAQRFRSGHFARTVRAISVVAGSWLLMQVVHESGHVLASLMTGGTVRKVVLVPWELSRTELIGNPHPLIVCWAGPRVGASAPVAAWLLARSIRIFCSASLRFFAGFCLIANGAYRGVGSFTRDGDAGDLLVGGSPAWTLWLFAGATVPYGFFLWHRLGKEFGFGDDAVVVSWRGAGASLLVLALILVVEIIYRIPG
jgi:hypothetical protein